jgi:Transposase zinc-binding domain
MILLSSIIQTFEAEYLATYQSVLLPSQHKALTALKQCRTTQSLGVLAQCDGCEKQIFIPHSCGHRNCPHCQHHKSQQWLERQLQKQVPAEYFLLTLSGQSAASVCPQNRAYGSVHGSSRKAYPLGNVNPMCQLSV